MLLPLLLCCGAIAAILIAAALAGDWLRDSRRIRRWRISRDFTRVRL